MAQLAELEIPTGAIEAKEADEFIRFWLADGTECVSLRVGAMGDREVEQWGMMLADLSVHIIRALHLDGSGLSKQELRASLEQAYLGRLSQQRSGDISGSLIGSKQ